MEEENKEKEWKNYFHKPNNNLISRVGGGKF
jgi:hypothetical protein